MSVSNWEDGKPLIWKPRCNKFLFRRKVQKRLYIIFSAALTILVIFCLIELYGTVSEMKHIKKRRSSRFTLTPRLQIIPRFNATAKEAFISYNNDDVSTVEKWINLIDEFLEDYRIDQRGINNENLASSCNFHEKPKQGRTCPIDLESFGPCSPPDYGYYGTSPCVFLYLTKVPHWAPDYYNNPKDLPKEMPLDLLNHISNADTNKEADQIWVSCNGIFDIDKEHVDKFEYYPSRGFPSYFFPYNPTLKHYLSPVIAVEINSPEPGVLINIECRLWVKNINYTGVALDEGTYSLHNDFYKQKGSVHFEVLLEAT